MEGCPGLKDMRPIMGVRGLELIATLPLVPPLHPHGTSLHPYGHSLLTHYPHQPIGYLGLNHELEHDICIIFKLKLTFNADSPMYFIVVQTCVE